MAAMLKGKSMPFYMVAKTNHTTLLKNRSAIIKISTLNAFPLKLRV